MTDKRMIAVFHYDNGRCGSEPYRYEELRRGEWIGRGYCQVCEDGYEVAECSVCGAEITIDPQYDSF